MVALIGVNGRGRQMAREFLALPGVRVNYVCDVDQSVGGPAMRLFEDRYGKPPKLVSDIRRVLGYPSVDAVVMATPIHWHASETLLACEGKDVYI
jgi:predicted dehydrogenase